MKPTDQQFDKWCRRHGMRPSDREAFEDAATLYMTEVDWGEAQRVCDVPEVDEAIRNLIEDKTNDNAVCMVRAIIKHALAAPAKPAEHGDLEAAVKMNPDDVLELRLVGGYITVRKQ